MYCSVCGKQLTPKRRRAGMLCAECDKTLPPRTEHLVWNAIKDALPPPSARDNLLLAPKSSGCAADPTRPDVAWVGTDRIVHLEIDEHSHDDRQPSCETKKLDSAAWGTDNTSPTGHRLPVIVVRFNPDNCDTDERTAFPRVEDRCARLITTLNWAIKTSAGNFDLVRVNVCYLFYHTKAQCHIDAALASPNIRVFQPQSA